MLLQALSAARDIGRLHEIASVLIRYGFADLVRRMGMANVLERAGRVLMWKHAKEYAHMEPQVRVRRALEELGPTFIKLGQVLSSRVDLFPPEWIAEFGMLQDRAPASPYDEVLKQLTADLGAPPEEVFDFFDPTPIAAASIAQVHRARLKDGTEVIVKVRKPGVRPIVEADLRLLTRLAEFAEAENPDWRNFRPHEVIRQFSLSLQRELDFAIECRNSEAIAENFIGYEDHFRSADAKILSISPPIIIPAIHWKWTSERVCVQDYIEGIPGRNLDELAPAGFDRNLLARRGAHAVLKMILEDGLFHADPHPGNVFYLPGNRLAFIDFGMVGRLTEGRRTQLVSLLLGLVQHEPDRVADVLLDWAEDATIDEANLTLEIQLFVDQYHGITLEQLSIGTMLNDIATILRSHQISLPSDLALLVKAFITLEGMGRELDPDFDMAGEALPMLEKTFRERYSPKTLAKRSWRSTTEILGLLVDLPHDISRLIRSARRGRLEIHIDVTNLKHVGNQLDGAANRLTVGLVVAALIVGSSIVMTVSGGPQLLGLPLFGLIGYLGAATGGLWLLLSIWKSNRADKD